MTAPLRIGLVGAGMVSAYHVAGWAACREAALCAIADADVTKARARAASSAPTFASLTEMCSAASLDAVDIATPPETHASLIAEAQAAGLHVLCQKPLAPNATAAREIEAAIRPSTRVMVHENWRWRAPYQALRASLEAGRVKRPGSFEFLVESAGLLLDQAGVYPALARQPFFAKMPRLLVFEVLVHHLDTLQFLLGDLDVNGARLSRRCPAIVGEDRAEIALSAGGVHGRLVADFCVEGGPPLPRDRLWFDGVCVVNGWDVTHHGGAPVSHDATQSYQESYTATLQHFVDCIRTGQPFATPVSSARKMLEIVDQIYDA